MSIEYRAGKTRPYLARVYVAGKHGSSRSFHTRAEAVAWESQAKLAVQRGEPLAVARNAPERITVADASRETIKAMLSGAFRTKKGTEYRRVSVDNYEYRLRLHVLPRIGGLLLTEVDRTTMIKLREDLLHAASPSTARESIEALRCVLRRYADRGVIPFNPGHDLPALAMKRRKPMFLMPDQARALQAQADAHRNPRIGLFIAIALATGARRGEIEALTWDRAKDMTIVIDAEAGNRTRRGAMEGPKSASGARTIPIGATTWSRIEAARSDGFVVGRLPQVPWDEIKPKGLHFHDLRHTAATFWLAAGMSVHAVADLLGHANARLVLSLYGHALPQETSQAGQIMDAYLGGASGGVTPPTPPEMPTNV